MKATSGSHDFSNNVVSGSRAMLLDQHLPTWSGAGACCGFRYGGGYHADFDWPASETPSSRYLSINRSAYSHSHFVTLCMRRIIHQTVDGKQHAVEECALLKPPVRVEGVYLSRRKLYGRRRMLMKWRNQETRSQLSSQLGKLFSKR